MFNDDLYRQAIKDYYGETGHVMDYHKWADMYKDVIMTALNFAYAMNANVKPVNDKEN